MNAATPRTRLIAGCMTGTSMDAIDAALLAIDGHGLGMRARLVAHASAPLGDLGESLRRFTSDRPQPASETVARLTRCSRELGERHAELLAPFASEHPVDFICVHGQTLVHHPPDSLQLINPHPIARALSCPVLTDLRGADLAAGGQGAPITPIADWVLFRSAQPTVVVNLGGFCNFTSLPAASDARGVEAVTGADVCACNQLLDSAARRFLNAPFDADGTAASRGTIDRNLHTLLVGWLTLQASASRSLGSGDEAGTLLESVAHLPPPDALATLASAVGTAIVRVIRSKVPELSIPKLVLAGGGVRNVALVHAIATECAGMWHSADVRTSDELGMPIEAREAACMAVLGALCADAVPITLARITRGWAHLDEGAPIAGVWTLPPHPRPDCRWRITRDAPPPDHEHED